MGLDELETDDIILVVGPLLGLTRRGGIYVTSVMVLVQDAINLLLLSLPKGILASCSDDCCDLLPGGS